MSNFWNIIGYVTERIDAVMDYTPIRVKLTNFIK